MAGFRLPAELDIRHIADVHGALAAELAAASGALALDAGAVTRIDTAGVQLIVAALADARVTLSSTKPSAAVLEAFAALGLGHLMNC